MIFSRESVPETINYLVKTRSFDMVAYGAHVERILAASIGNTPESQITRAALRELLMTRIDGLCEGLPAISQLPSPEDIERLAPTIGGVLVALQTAPTMRDIAEYTAASAADVAEMAVYALPNGLTAFSMGSSDKLS